MVKEVMIDKHGKKKKKKDFIHSPNLMSWALCKV